MGGFASAIILILLALNHILKPTKERNKLVIAFLNSVLLVVVGEMGDKTQLLVMGMASKYKVRYIISGVLIALILNQSLAVLVGSYVGSVLPISIISIGAGISFVVFGLWTIRGDSVDGSGEKISHFSPTVTVAIAFFLAEMGDRTQLMTISLAAEYRNPVGVFMGTITGMAIADGIGLIFGAWICKHIPEIYIKWVAGMVFMVFGTITLYTNVPGWLLNPIYIVFYLVVNAVLIYLLGFRFAKRSQQPCEAIEEHETR